MGKMNELWHKDPRFLGLWVGLNGKGYQGISAGEGNVVYTDGAVGYRDIFMCLNSVNYVF